MSTTLSPGGYVRQGQRGASPPRSVNVQVAVRCRPLNDRERSQGDRTVLSCDESRHEVLLSAPNAQRKNPGSGGAAGTAFSASGKKTFTYDHVFSPAASQEDVYARVVDPIVEEVLEGYNCTVFAYGQTGTGKTHTMEGRRHDDMNSVSERRLPENAGIIPRAIQQIFNYLRSLSDEHSVRVSHLELYNEQLTDLLGPDEISADSLRVYEDPTKGTFVQGLEDTVVRSEQEIFAVLDKSALKRKTAETLMNKYSSRSHSIFSITIHIKESTPDGQDLLKVGKLNLVDLAGSENVGRSGAVKGRAREAGNINQSLLTLGRVITALVDRHPHVPYRDSKLTRLLQESLGGRNKTCIIATVTPGSNSSEETLSTLDYAYRAKSIKNRPTVNQMIAKHVLLKEYTEEISKLKRELDATREKNGVYITPEEYSRMQRTTSSQGTQITDLETEKEELERRNDGLKQKLSRTQDALERDQKILAETRETLSTTTAVLNETKQELTVTTQQRNENAHLVRAHVQVEKSLKNEGEQLQGTLGEAISDVRALHERVSVHTSLESENRESLDKLKEVVSSSVAGICQQLETHREEQTVAVKGTKQHLGEAVDAMESGLSEIFEKIDSFWNALDSFEEENTQAREADDEELSTKIEQNASGCEGALEEHGSSLGLAETDIRKRCATVSDSFVRAREALVTIRTCIAGHGDEQEQLLSKFEEDSRVALSVLEGDVRTCVQKQKGYVDDMLASRRKEQEEEQEAMKRTRAQLLDQISTAMDAFISQGEDRIKKSAEEDARLSELVKKEQDTVTEKASSLRNATGENVQALLDAHSSTTSALAAKLDDMQASHGEQETTGIRNVEEVVQKTGEIRETFGKALLCAKEKLSSAKQATTTFRRKRTGRCEAETQSRKSRRAECKDGLCSTAASSRNNFNAARESTEGVLDGIESRAEELGSSAAELLQVNVQQTVHSHEVLVDQDREATPTVREWSVIEKLPATRCHSDLIGDLRATSGTGSVPLEDFGQRELVGEIPVESTRNAEEDALESSTDSPVDTENGSDLLDRPHAMTGTDDEGVDEEEEEEPSAKAEAGKEKDVVVLADTTNKRGVGRGSKPKITPVIKKAVGGHATSKKSNIPVPKTRYSLRKQGGS